MAHFKSCFIFIFTVLSICVFGQGNDASYKPFRVGLKWGIKDTLGNVTLQPSYDYIIKSNKTNYFEAAKTTEIKKFLIHDSLREALSDTDYKAYRLDDFNDNYEDDSIVYLYKPDLFLIDKSGNRITPEKYSYFENWGCCYIAIKDKQIFFISSNAKPKGPWGYYFPFYKNKSENESPDFFLVNLDGEKKDFNEYDTIMTEDPYSGELLNKVEMSSVNYRKGGRFALLNEDGDRIIHLDFEDLKISTCKRDVYGYGEGERIMTEHLSVSDSLSWARLSDNFDINSTIYGKVKGKWGVFTWGGKIIVPFNYDSLELYSNNMEPIYKVCNNGKYYFLSPGKPISPPFDNFIELIKPDSVLGTSIAGYIFQNGGLLRDIVTSIDSVYIENWETGEQELRVVQKITPCFFGGKFKILNQNLELITKDEYDSLRFHVSVYDYVTGEETSRTNLRNFSDTTCKISSTQLLPDKPMYICKNGLWGLIKTSGETIIPAEYMSLQLFRTEPEVAYLGVRNEKKYFIVPGKIISPAFDNYLELQKTDTLQNIQTAFYIIQNGGKLKDVFVRTVERYNYEREGEMDWITMDSLYTPCFFGGKLKILNENLEPITNDEYDSLKFYVKDIKDYEVESILLKNLSDRITNCTSLEIVNDKPILTCKNRLWGAIKTNGELFIPNIYNSLSQEYYNSTQVFEIRCEGMTGALTLDGKTLFEPVYSGFNFYQPDISSDFWAVSLAFFYKNGKMGVINMQGKEIIPAVYDSLLWDEGNFVVNVGGKKKQRIIENSFLGMDPNTGMDIMVRNVINRVYMIGGKWGMIDSAGKPIVEIKYDQLFRPVIPYSFYGEQAETTGSLFIFTSGGKNEMAEIKENDTIIDYEDFQQNPEIFPNIINKIKKNTENIFSHAKYGLVDKTGKEIISQCDTIVYTNWEVTDMNGEYHNTCYVAIIDTAYKVFDKNGNIISPNSDFYNYINQTTTYLDNEVALYGLKNYLGQIVLPPTYKMIGTLNYERMVVRKDNKLGFINSTGEVVIPIIYDEADSFRYGKAKVKQNGKSFFIDVSGNVVK